MQIIVETLRDVVVGQAVNAGNLTMFPILSGNEDVPDYLILDEALAKGTASVSEISDAGSVPELMFVNKGDWPVLLVDGEELIGAKQNRILNLTILVPAHRHLKIPVSCVERGRWSYSSKSFAAAPRAQFAAARARRTAFVSFSLRETGSRVADQQAVWQDNDRMLFQLDVDSPTSAMSDIYDSYSEQLDEKVRALSEVEGQTGAVFAINGEIVGLELLDHASTFRKLLPKLVRSYEIEALARRKGARDSEAPGEAAVHGFLKSVVDARAERFAALGEGEDVRIQRTDLSAAALVARNRLVHLCAFRITEPR